MHSTPGMRRNALTILPLALLVGLGALAALVVACAGPQPGPIPTATLPPDRGALTTNFVTDFMEARARGDEEAARLFLSPTAAEQFTAGAGGLTLAADGGGFAGWAILAAEPADASSHEVRVRVEPHGGAAWEELLFVGVGPGPDGETRDLTVRGAERLPAPAI